jgi:hypothetical protein
MTPQPRLTEKPTNATIREVLSGIVTGSPVVDLLDDPRARRGCEGPTLRQRKWQSHLDYQRTLSTTRREVPGPDAMVETKGDSA